MFRTLLTAIFPLSIENAVGSKNSQHLFGQKLGLSTTSIEPAEGFTTSKPSPQQQHRKTHDTTKPRNIAC